MRFSRLYIVSIITMVSVTSVTYAANVSSLEKTRTTITRGYNPSFEETSSIISPSLPEKKPVTDQQLDLIIEQETKHINAAFQSSLKAVLRGYKNGQPDMVVMASDMANSIPISQVVRQDELDEAENRKRQIEEIALLERYRNGEITEGEIKQQALRSIFPVTTSLKPTQLPSREIKIDRNQANHFSSPIAVIGADRYSLEWFRLNIGAIRRLKASVVVTQVDNFTDFQAIQKFAPDVMMQPVDGRMFLEAIGVNVYPILITSQGAFQ
ncbi:PFL_4695 family integrating conjugative element protein [Vibrio mediterranei]